MFKRFNRDNIQLNDVEFMGFENQVAIEYTVNDYCACLSIGEFSEERANLIRVRGNNDIGAYVVYDIIKLRMTISEILIDSIDKRDFAILSRNIVYGLKDRKWDVEDTLSIIKDRNPMALWLGATFVKNEIFRHE